MTVASKAAQAASPSISAHHSPAVEEVSASPRDSKYLLQDDDEAEFAKMSTPMKVVRGLLYTILALSALYVFLVSVKLVGDSFALMLGCNAKGAFDFADNPVAGIMIGVVTTALVQSSSTTTSIAVALVSSGAMTVRQAVPVIMGANIGTCVTSTMVAFGQVGNREQFERAMAAATVHDMYNIWTVIVFFPLEILFHPLEKIGMELSHLRSDSGKFDSFVSKAVKPLAGAILSVDKKKVKKIAAGTFSCEGQSLIKTGVFKDSSLSDTAVGAIVLVIGLVFLVLALIALVKVLSKLFLGGTRRVVSKVLNYNGYVNIVVGAVITFIVQSSSITTSTVTPLAGLGLVSLEQVYPMVLGANLGTTTTALLASLVTTKSNAVAIALVHLFFNLFGIALFYPIPFMRRPILHWARSLAYFSSCWSICGILFISMVFIGAPCVLLLLVYLCTASSTGVVVIGWILVAVIVLSGFGFWFWYMQKGGQQRWYAFLEAKREASIEAEAQAEEKAANGAVNAV